jgi:phosphoserine phosphatase RsbU/P
MSDLWQSSALFPLVASLSRSELRWELINIAVAVAFLSAALSAIALFFFRRGARDLTLVYFSLLLILYAVRLLALRETIRSLFDLPRIFWIRLDWGITCCIALPLSLFLLQVAGKRFRLLFRWMIAAQAAFAIFGIIAPALGAPLRRLQFANSIVILATVVVAALFLLTLGRSSGPGSAPSREVRVFIAGFVVWLIFVVHANLAGLRMVRGPNVEFIGFLAFVAALAYIAAYRVFANEERLHTINKELEIARRIQSSIIPQSVPKRKGLEIAARYAPMSAVAGDFYDFLEVDEQRLGVLVADVTGHGIPAALIASMLKVAFAGQVAYAHDPARLLAGLNATLCGKFEEHFVTAAYLFVDLEKSLVRYSAAGHPPLLLASPGANDIQEIEQNGLMLGLFPEAAYTSAERAITRGDRCVLYTDGVVEARNSAEEEFGKARLREFLRAAQDASADPLADALLRAVMHWSGSRDAAEPVQDDDITLLIVDFASAHPPPG